MVIDTNCEWTKAHVTAIVTAIDKDMRALMGLTSGATVPRSLHEIVYPRIVVYVKKTKASTQWPETL